MKTCVINKKNFGSYRSNVKVENFKEERWDVGKVRVQAPVNTEVSDDNRPDWTRREYLTPRHLTQLTTKNINTIKSVKYNLRQYTHTTLDKNVAVHSRQ